MCPERPGFLSIWRFFHQVPVNENGFFLSERQQDSCFGDRKKKAGGTGSPVTGKRTAGYLLASFTLRKRSDAKMKLFRRSLVEFMISSLLPSHSFLPSHM